MKRFDELLAEHRTAVERYVKFRLPSEADGEDILQEVYMTAFERFGQLQDPAAFKSWLLQIARNRCADYFRAQARRLELPLEDLPEKALDYGRLGFTETLAVRDALERLGDIDKRILYLFYWKQLPQAEIACRLDIPVGTVKSRLHTAKGRFKDLYLHRSYERKEVTAMKKTKLPELLPEYTIERDPRPPFTVKWEELQGWPCVPRLGEKITWGLYDQPSRRRTEWTDMQVVGRAQVHGIEGVEIVAIQHDAEDYYRTGSVNELERRFVAQLTDAHCRYLAESHMENGVRKVYTFLDGEDFINNWGFGPDNCGNETNLAPRGLLQRDGNVITGQVPQEVLDVVGRYKVTIGGKSYDTVCVMDANCFNDAVASEDYIDQNGRTVLWRRFNRDDWALEHFGGKPWSEQLPDNERLIVNGQTYVHWYDCITDYHL